MESETQSVASRSSDSRGGLRLRAASALSVLTAALLLGSLTPTPADAGRLPVRKAPVDWSELRSEDGSTQRVERISRFHRLKAQMPEAARHGHLQLGPRMPSLFERADLERRPSLERGAGGPDTLLVKIAVIRIEFETDREGDRTTGDGRFMQEDSPDSIFIDPAPHDDAYFQAHIEAVSRYWTSMTYGGVRFEGDVFPRGDRFGAYRLSDMADYGPETPDEPFNIPNLIQYSRDALHRGRCGSGPGLVRLRRLLRRARGIGLAERRVPGHAAWTCPRSPSPSVTRNWSSPTRATPSAR